MVLIQADNGRGGGGRAGNEGKPTGGARARGRQKRAKKARAGVALAATRERQPARITRAPLALALALALALSSLRRGFRSAERAGGKEWIAVVVGPERHLSPWRREESYWKSQSGRKETEKIHSQAALLLLLLRLSLRSLSLLSLPSDPFSHPPKGPVREAVAPFFFFFLSEIPPMGSERWRRNASGILFQNSPHFPNAFADRF